MVFVRKCIDVVSPANGKHYTSITKYERDHESKGQYIMEDKQYRQLSEKLRDESNSSPKKVDRYNHVHIDFANGRVEKSLKE